MLPCVVGAVVALTVMRALFVCEVHMPNYCEGDGNADVGAECEYMGCTRGSGVASNAANLLEMSVVRDVRGVGGVCKMCMCLAWGGVGVSVVE